MNGRASYVDHRGDVGFDGISYHQYLFRGEVVLGGKFKVVRLVLVLHDLAVMEISVQAGLAVFV